jgi:hypothetical protein
MSHFDDPERFVEEFSSVVEARRIKPYAPRPLTLPDDWLGLEAGKAVLEDNDEASGEQADDLPTAEPLQTVPATVVPRKAFGWRPVRKRRVT